MTTRTTRTITLALAAAIAAAALIPSSADSARRCQNSKTLDDPRSPSARCVNKPPAGMPVAGGYFVRNSNASAEFRVSYSRSAWRVKTEVKIRGTAFTCTDPTKKPDAQSTLEAEFPVVKHTRAWKGAVSGRKADGGAASFAARIASSAGRPGVMTISARLTFPASSVRYPGCSASVRIVSKPTKNSS